MLLCAPKSGACDNVASAIRRLYIIKSTLDYSAARGSKSTHSPHTCRRDRSRRRRHLDVVCACGFVFEFARRSVKLYTVDCTNFFNRTRHRTSNCICLLTTYLNNNTIALFVSFSVRSKFPALRCHIQTIQLSSSSIVDRVRRCPDQCNALLYCKCHQRTSSWTPLRSVYFQTACELPSSCFYVH